MSTFKRTIICAKQSPITFFCVKYMNVFFLRIPLIIDESKTIMNLFLRMVPNNFESDLSKIDLRFSEGTCL